MQGFIVRNGKFICNIRIASTAPDTAIPAAGELARCLAAASGIRPQVLYGQAETGEILLGAESGDCALEELRLKIRNGILQIDGGRRGILYGVYELLERLGFRFFTVDCERIPQEMDLSVPADWSVQYTPLFEYRHVYWQGALNPDFAPRLRINGSAEIPESKGGGIPYEGFVHTLGDLAEMEGDFTDRQPCLTDERVFQTVVKNLRKRLRDNPKAQIASISQNDSHEWGRGCDCPQCRALDAAEGTPMGSLLHFVNRVADELKDEFPQVSFDTLSYRYTRKPPRDMHARENVIVRLCSIEACFSHPIEECTASTERVDDGSFSNCLKTWKNHCDRLYVWDYTTNFWNYHASYPNFAVLRKNVRFFAENHVRGVFEQGNTHTVSGEFGELRVYLLAKLLWNPMMSEEEYQRHIREFMEGYYGAGAVWLMAFLNRLQQSVQQVHFGIYFKDPTEYIADGTDAGSKEEGLIRFLEQGRADFARALEMASPIQRVRIERAEIQLDLYEWYTRNAILKSLAEDSLSWESAREALRLSGIRLYGKLLNHGIREMREYGPHCLWDAVPDYLTPPSDWDDPAER